MKNPVSFLRVCALLEAVSYLLLLFIAMPLKYVWGIPEAVKVTGMAHGVLFVLLCFALGRVLMSTSWPISRAALVFVASLVPFVPFFMDGKMRAWAEQNDAPQA